MGWLARTVSFEVRVRTLTPHARLAHLYTGNPHAITSFFAYLGPRGPLRASGIEVPVEPGAHQHAAMGQLTERIRDEAIAFLDQLPDLDSVATVLQARLVERERGPDPHDLEALGATYVLLGRDDEARSALRTLIDEIDATDQADDIVVPRGYDNEPDEGWTTIPALSPWMSDVRTRARAMSADLDADPGGGDRAPGRHRPGQRRGDGPAGARRPLTGPRAGDDVQRVRTTRAGVPRARTPDGMSRLTTAPAPMTLSAPMVTPGRTMTPPPSHTLSPMVMGSAPSHLSRR